MRRLLAAVAALLLMTPVAIIATFLLLPFWRWFEVTSGVRAVGHASLAEWCFVATWLLVAPPVALLASRAFARRAGSAGPPV